MENRVWHKSYSPGVPVSVDIQDTTMPEILARIAKKYPERTAMFFFGKKTTYAELDRLADRFAVVLDGLGVKPGDRIALLMPNIPQMVIAFFGIWRAGAVPAPNNPLYTDRELEQQLNDSGATLAVTMDLLAPRLLALREKTSIRKIITAHINDYMSFPVKQLFPVVKKSLYHKYRKAPEYYQFLDLMKNATAGYGGTPPSPDSLALIPYTGGTTGKSKGVMLSHRNLSSMAQILQASFFDIKETPEGEPAIFPFFHSAGFSLVMDLCVINGWSMALIPRPDARAVCDTLIKYRSTMMIAVPTIYIGLLALPEFRKADFSFVKGFFSGAAPLSLETINALRDATGASIVEGLGMTESTAAITLTPWRGTLKPGSVGVPLPNTDVRIVDLETGTKDMAVGEAGEIIFRGPQMCSGYYNMPEETADTIRDGWFYTGDIGKFDEDGYIYVVDRKKDMIIAAGYNIYPKEIDEILYSHSGVQEACTVGIPHEYRGETVKAFIIPKPGVELTAEEMNAFCRSKLAAYKVPHMYEFVKELPKSAVGKILRRELRDRELKRNKAG
jgi:long-chain acyl-CoA synthetase